MKNAKRSVSPRSVFIVCEVGSNIHHLIELLHTLGLRTLNLDAALEPDLATTSTTRELITKADFVCAVLTATDSPPVYLDLGYAMGLQRPVVVISDVSTLPVDLTQLLWIRASLNDRSALTFQLKAFLANLDSHAAHRRTKILHADKHPTLGSKLMTSAPPDSALERELLQALEQSPEIKSIAQKPRINNRERNTFIPDFAVWLAVDSKVIESPLIIELKGGREDIPAVDVTIEQVKHFALAGDVPAGLVVLAEPPDCGLRVVSIFPLIFVLSFKEVRLLLAAGKLIDTLGRERNRVVHSAR